MSTLKQKAQSILDEKESKIIAENIKKDITVFGVTGTLESLDTSDADALDIDIVSGKTAYVNGSKVIGNIPERKSNNVQSYTDIRTNGITGNVEGDLYATVSSIVNKDILFRKDSIIKFSLDRDIMQYLRRVPVGYIKKGYNSWGEIGTYDGITDSSLKVFKFPSLSIMKEHLSTLEFSEYKSSLEDINENIDGMKAIVNKITTSEKSIVYGDILKWDNIEICKEVTLTKEENNNIYNLQIFDNKILDNQLISSIESFLNYSYETQTIELHLSNDEIGEEYTFQYTQIINDDETVTYILNNEDYNIYKSRLEEISKLDDNLDIEYGLITTADNEYNFNILNKFIYKKKESIGKYVLNIGFNIKYSNLKIEQTWQVSSDLLQTLNIERPNINIYNTITHNKVLEIQIEYGPDYPELVVYVGDDNITYRYMFDSSTNIFSISSEDYTVMLNDIANYIQTDVNCVVSEEDTYKPDLLVDLIYSDVVNPEKFETFDIYELQEDEDTYDYRWIKPNLACNNIDDLIINPNFVNIGPRLYFDDGVYYKSNDYKSLIENDRHPIGKFVPVSLSYSRDLGIVNIAFYWKYLTEDTNFPFSIIYLLFEPYYDKYGELAYSGGNEISLSIDDARINTMLFYDELPHLNKNSWSNLYTLTFDGLYQGRDIPFTALQNVKDIIFYN